MNWRVLLLGLFAARLAIADDDPNRVTQLALANALHSGDAKAVASLFDSKMHGFGALRTGVEHLLEAAEVSLSFDLETCVWTIEIIARDLAAGVTRRQAKVIMRVDAGVIQRFEPVDFLAPPPGRQAWDTLFGFATALQNEDAAPGMEQFDRAMPGFQELKSAVNALWTQRQIEPAIELLGNEGDDTHRTLQVDWTLNLKNPADPVDSFRREQSVTCRVDKQGKGWRIVGFTPANLFAASK
jgi:hypothetical protein